VKAYNARVPAWLRDCCVVLDENAYKPDLQRMLNAEAS
jgi:hypothetical protein